MVTPTVNQTDIGTQKRGEALRPPSHATEFAVREARDMAVLLAWMVQAQHVLRGIQVGASVSPQLEELLQTLDVRYNHAWENEHAEAVAGLFIELQDRIEALGAGVAHGC